MHARLGAQSNFPVRAVSKFNLGLARAGLCTSRMIRRNLSDKIREAAKAFPAVTITGPRQSGKSTLCRALFPRHPYANLEQPDLRSLALNDPRAFLAAYPDEAIIDEVQRCPDLLSYIQVLIDEKQTPGRWILTGS